MPVWIASREILIDNGNVDNEKIFFLSNGINLLGPFTKEELLRMVYNGELKKDARVYDISTSQWCKMENHPKFTRKDFEENNLVIFGLHSSNNNETGIKIKRPKKLRALTSKSNPASSKPATAAPPTKANAQPPPLETGFISTSIVEKQSLLSNEKWYIADGKFLLGPYHYLSLIYMLKQGTIPFDQSIRREDQKEFKTIEDILTARELKSLTELDCLKYQVEMPKDLTSRRFERKNVDFYLYFTFNGTQYIVQAYDISAYAIAFVTHEGSFSVREKGECAMIQKDESILAVTGSILRKDEVKSRKIDTKLFKYAFFFDREVQLENVIPVPDVEDE